MRARDLLAILAGLAVVGGVGYLGWQALEGELAGEEEPDPERDPATTADAYLDAWAAGDVAAMRQYLRVEPEGFEQAHRQLEEALAPREVRVERGELDQPVDGEARAPVTVELTLDEPVGRVAWETELELVRTRGTWEVSWSPSTLHPELRAGWGFATTQTPVDREPVLAADGTPLAGGDAASLGFVPQSVDDPDDVVEAFADALPGSEVVAEREFSRDELVDDWYYPVATVSAARAELAWQELRGTAGITAPRSADDARVLLDVGFAQHVVGVVREATAEQLEERPELEAGDQIGQFGLEAALEDRLLGSERTEVGLRELGDDRELRHVLGEGQREPSEPIRTTLDVAVQRAIELTLADVDAPAALVAVSADDGRIVGSASRPLTGFNRAFSGLYPPGSTFKIVTAEAALAAGLDLDDTVDCPQESIVGGLAVSNYEDLALGSTTLLDAFARSCNTTFAQLGAELGDAALADAARRFGFGTDPDLPLTANGGSFPDPADTAELAAAAFGQARVQVSPLHVATMAAAVEQGAWHPPYLLADDDPGTRQDLATGAPDRLRELLTAVVTDGTGDAAAVQGAEVAGKTGTAETDGASHAWFAGTFDGLGFAVFVEGGGSGGEVAAPLAAEFVEHLRRLRDSEVDPADPASARTDPSARLDEAETGGDDP